MPGTLTLLPPTIHEAVASSCFEPNAVPYTIADGPGQLIVGVAERTVSWLVESETVMPSTSYWYLIVSGEPATPRPAVAKLASNEPFDATWTLSVTFSSVTRTGQPAATRFPAASRPVTITLEVP